MTTNNTPQVFHFTDSLALRGMVIDGAPWFVAADICQALEIVNTTRALSSLDDDEQALHTMKGLSRGNNQANLVNESGLYALIFKSRKPAARQFKKWVTRDVLPSIRRTGGYQIGVSLDQQAALKIAVQRLAAAERASGATVFGRFKRKFAVASYAELDAARIDEALRWLDPEAQAPKVTVNRTNFYHLVHHAAYLAELVSAVLPGLRSLKYPKIEELHGHFTEVKCGAHHMARCHAADLEAERAGQAAQYR